MDIIAEQIERETQRSAEAEAKAVRELREYMQKGDIDKLPKAKLLIGNMFPVVEEYLRKEQEKVARGPGAHLKGWLRAIPSDVAAVIALQDTLRLVLGAGFRTIEGDFGATVQRISASIARSWVLEAKIRQAEKVNPAYYEATMRGIDRANITSAKHIQMSVQRVIRNNLGGLYEMDLTPTELLQLGKHGLQACLEAGLLQVVRSTGKSGHIVTYKLAPEVYAFLSDERDVIRLARDNHGPLVAPPLPWEDLMGGGFYTERNQARSPLVDWRRRVRRSAVPAYKAASTAERMPMVYDYCNYVQSIPYTVDQRMYSIVADIWSRGGGMFGMPSTTPPTKPEFPFPESWKKATASEEELETFAKWKYHSRRWYEAVRKHRATLWEMSSFVRHARELGDRAIYYPVFLDTRSRLYYRCAPSPQGTDCSKAVLQFHRKKPLGERGVYWLKVHIANCFGEDTGKFDARVRWVDDNWDRLKAAAEGLDAASFEDADSPLCALAACLELRDALASPDPRKHLCGLPVHMDATCSGLQHFSAMLRDEVGGSYVNLTAGGDTKADVYRRVADLVALQVARDAAGGVLEAKEWVSLGISRSLAKGPVMTYVYGATLRSVADGVIDWLTEEGWSSETVKITAMARYMARLLFKGIEDTVPAAAAAMRWIRQSMGGLKRDQPVQWVTPLGFTVNHDYREEDRTRVRIRSCGQEYVVMYEKLDTLSLARTKNAISPNFVHSLDATHLGMTALRMHAGGRDMVCIHDSFGTHPCDVDAMHRDIREAFVQLYSRDVLGDFAQQLAIEAEPPQQGRLNLADVLRSEFFFC